MLELRNADLASVQPVSNERGAEQERSFRVMVVDDHALVRDLVAAHISFGTSAEVTVAGCLDEAMQRMADDGPFDLVLLDLNMPGMHGVKTIGRAIEANGGKPVAIISGSCSADIAQAAIEAGAAGFVPKTLAAKSILAAVKFMAEGEVYAPFKLMSSTPDSAAAQAGLTPRERDVLRGLSEGKANKEIARDLDLQEVTVKLHVKTLCRKLQARNRTQAALIARDRNLV